MIERITRFGFEPGFITECCPTVDNVDRQGRIHVFIRTQNNATLGQCKPDKANFKNEGSSKYLKCHKVQCLTKCTDLKSQTLITVIWPQAKLKACGANVAPTHLQTNKLANTKCEKKGKVMLQAAETKKQFPKCSSFNGSIPRSTNVKILNFTAIKKHVYSLVPKWLKLL